MPSRPQTCRSGIDTSRATRCGLRLCIIGFQIWAHHRYQKSTMPLQTAVTGLSFSPDGAFAVSMAAGDRQLAVWALGGKGGKKRKAQQPALATLTLQETAIHVCSAPAPDVQAFQVLPPTLMYT